MGIGVSVFLIAIGAILAFAVNVSVGWLDLSVVGWVLIVAGLFGLLYTTWLWQSRRREVVTTREPVVERPVVERPVVERPGVERTVEERRREVRPPEVY